MKTIDQAIEWAQKRLELQGKALDVSQIEVLKLALHELAAGSAGRDEMTMAELHRIITNPRKDDGYEIHLKHLWHEGRADRIFYLTGLDVSRLLNPHTPIC